MTVKVKSAVNVKQLLSYLKKLFEEIYQIYIIIEKQEEALLHSDSEYLTQLSIKKKLGIKKKPGIKKKHDIKKKPNIKKKLDIKKKLIVKKESVVKKKPYISMKFNVL